jgi:hypothetical protein
MLCSPIRANRGGGRIIGVIELINKSNGELFDSNDEDLLAQLVYQFTDDLSSEFSELLEINHNISSFATPILPSDGMMSRASSGAIPAEPKAYQGPTAVTANYRNLVDSTKKYLEQRSDSSTEAGFRLGNVGHQEWEGENRRRERRRSFGERLSSEIERNPELLHVRKDR